MSNPNSSDSSVHITPEQTSTFRFSAFRNKSRRFARQYHPENTASRDYTLKTPWGEELTVSPGDYIVSESGNPEDAWPVEKHIFEKTYVEVEPGVYIKNAVVELVPLWQVVESPDDMVTVSTLEGNVSVRAADFYLARGIDGEIWPIPKEKVENSMEQFQDKPRN